MNNLLVIYEKICLPLRLNARHNVHFKLRETMAISVLMVQEDARQYLRWTSYC